MTNTEPSSELASSSAAKRSFLLVEDDAGDRRMVLELLRETELADVELLNAGNVDQAQALAHEQLDAALVDLNLGAGSGLDLVARLRERFPDLPIVVLTGGGDEMAPVQAFRSGADDYLPKSRIGPVALEHVLMGAIARRRQAKQVRESAAKLALFAELTDTASDYLFIVDCESDEIVLGNLVTRRALGRAEEDFAQKPSPIANLFHAGQSSWVAIRSLLSSSWSIKFETAIWAGSFVGRPVEVSARLVMRGTRSYVVCIARDITEQRRLQTELLSHAQVDPVTDLPRAENFLRAWQVQTLTQPALSELVALVGIAVPALEGAGLSTVAGSLADWRVRIAGMICDVAEPRDGKVGVASETGFWLALQGHSREVIDAVVDSLRRNLQTLCANLPPPAGYAGSSLVRATVGFGVLLGNAHTLVRHDSLAMAIALAQDAVLRPRSVIMKDVEED